MKKIILGLLALMSFSMYAESLSAYEIMKRNDELDSCASAIYTATMTLVNKKGVVRKRKLKCYSKDYGEVTKSVMVFLEPQDVEGTAFLSWEYEEKDGIKKDDDSWLYMPAMKSTRRITSSNKDDEFMGSDFTYDNIGDRGLTKDTFTLIGEEKVDGYDCYKIDIVAKKATEKTPHKIFWISKDNFLLIKGEFYDRQERLLKVLTTSGHENIDGYWQSKVMTMKNLLTGHSTVFTKEDSQFDKAVDDNLFTVQAMEKGRIK